MSEAHDPGREVARLIKRVVRFREQVATWRRLGLPMPFRRARKNSLLRDLAAHWTGALAPTVAGDLVYLPAPLDFQALRLLFGEGGAPPPALNRLPPGGVAFDIGANLGEWTLPLARAAGPGGRVLAFEPNPTVADALARSLRIGGLRQVTLHRAALSDSEGTAPFIVAAGNSGESRIGAAADGSEIQVRTRLLDAVAAEAGLARIDLVKIDVEGHERKVLEGGRATIERFRPALVVEIGHETGEDRAALADLYESLGYAAEAVLLDEGALPASLADYRAARGACAAVEPRNLMLLPR